MKRLAISAVGTGAGTLLYTAPTGFRANVLDICISNTTSAGVSCTIHIVPVGSSPAAANQMFPAISVPPNTLVQWSGTQVLSAGDFIQAIGGASGITVIISGEESRVGL